MDIYFLDNMSVKGKGFLHRMSTRVKLPVFVALLLLVILISNASQLFWIYLMLTVIIWRAKLPVWKIFLLSLYPIVFMIIFAISVPYEYFPAIILKILDTTTLTLLLVATTPYYEIFKMLSRVLPGIIVQIMFITYRSIFIIFDMMQGMFNTLKLRGGIDRHNPIRTIKLIARSFGYLLVRSADMAERVNDITYLRGLDL